MRIKKNRIVADEEIDVVDVPEEDEGAMVNVEDTDLLFEAEDVAELVAEVTGQPVEVTVQNDGQSVDFAVGEDVFTVQAEGDEEILETSRRSLRGKKAVQASQKTQRGRRVRRYK